MGRKQMKPLSRSASTFPTQQFQNDLAIPKPIFKDRSGINSSQTEQENALPSSAQDFSSNFSNNPLNEHDLSRPPMRNPRFPNRHFVPPQRPMLIRTDSMSSDDNSSSYNQNFIRPVYRGQRTLAKRGGGPGRVRMMHNHPNQILNTRNLGVQSPSLARNHTPGDYKMRAYYPPPRIGQPRMSSRSPQTKKMRFEMRGTTSRPPRPMPRM
ncbi:hypothetical protein SNEBB_010423 [Seison nebaliae]|nr:hypothetical protein SNEBB_010423 [Seison nebaliae]